MDQNVLTTSDVQFNSVLLSKTSETAVTFEANTGIATSQRSSTQQIASFPAIVGKTDTGIVTSSPTQLVENSKVRVDSIILGSVQSQDLSITTFKHANGSFKYIVNNHSTSDFPEGTIIVNFVIL